MFTHIVKSDFIVKHDLTHDRSSQVHPVPGGDPPPFDTAWGLFAPDMNKVVNEIHFANARQGVRFWLYSLCCWMTSGNIVLPQSA